jgi:hypothetical protein
MIAYRKVQMEIHDGIEGKVEDFAQMIDNKEHTKQDIMSLRSVFAQVHIEDLLGYLHKVGNIYSKVKSLKD